MLLDRFTKNKIKKATLDGTTINIQFHEDDALVKLMRHIHQCKRQHKGPLELWEAPLTLDAIIKLGQENFELSTDLLKWKESIFLPVKYNPNFIIPGIKHWDYFTQYQKEGVQYIDAKKGRALLADDPGLGKTMQILSWYQLRRRHLNPTLIICPANAKWTWYNEAHFWLENPNVQIINGYEETKIHGDLVIINYDILTHSEKGKDVFRKDIWGVHWKLLVLDEGHYVVNTESIRGWAISQMVDRVLYLIIATATPGDKNKHKFTLVNFIDKRIFPCFFKFAHRYCNAHKGYKGIWNYDGSSNEIELNHLLTNTIMLRRTKEEVFDNYQQPLRQVISLPINNRNEYDKLDTGTYTFETIEKLTQLAVKGKLDSAIEWIQDLLKTSKKIIIFADHKTTVNILMDVFGDIAVKIDGSTTDRQREEAKQLFQQCKRCKIKKERHDLDPNACKEYIYDMSKRIFIGTSAAKESITLTAAYDIIFLELWWVADFHTQAEGRPFGRKGDLHSGTSWYLIAHDTIEEYKANIYDLKNTRNLKVMDGKTLTKEQMLIELIKQRRNK